MVKTPTRRSDLRSDQEAATVLWLAGGSCEGCSMAMLGAADPGIEALLLARIPDLPPVRLVHPLLSFEAGDAYLTSLQEAASGALSTLILVVEGSIFDPGRAGKGFFSGMGERNGRIQTVTDWLDRLAPEATAVIAIGTCATWGGVPAAARNPTGAMGLTDYLGESFRGRSGLPVINVPGCAPPGDNFVETLVYLLLHLSEKVPLELDERRRPRWLYAEETHPQPARADYLPPHAFQTDVTVQCRVPQHGWMNNMGGCVNVGGACNGCTMPGFPDKFLSLAAAPKAVEER